ncbi:hypothetical protein N9L06_05395 [Mariniblastus sp.]|nr:hypothetical protein [Mariniblastus sp.]
MTAVVVAMIGVFGTLVLIPFAVKQAQSGLDLDDARNLAVNSRATFEVMRFNDSLQWVLGNGNEVAGDPATDALATLEPGFNSVFMIDPLWIYANDEMPPSLDANVGRFVDPDILTNFGLFGDGILEEDPDETNAVTGMTLSTGAPVLTAYPFHGQVNPALPAELRIFRASLPAAILSASRRSTLMPDALAQRLFRSTDALSFSKFDTDDGDLAGQPVQIFDRDATGNILRRQTTGGRLSQVMIMIPGHNQVRGVYRRVTLVFADRQLTLFKNPGGTRPNGQDDVVASDSNVNLRSLMLSAMVTTRGTLPDDLPTGFEGGEIVICPVDWSNPDGTGRPMPNQRLLDVAGISEAPGVRRDDWVMMTNFLPPGYQGVVNFRRQIEFYRVANIDEGEGDPGAVVQGRNLPSLTLDGPTFDFGPDGSDRVRTYIVHLRDVVNVYEDSIVL